MSVLLSLCCATEALRGFPCTRPQFPRRATIGCQGGHNCDDPSQNYPPDGWNQPVPVDGRALHELGGTAISPSTPLERFQVDLMDFEAGGPGEVPEPTCPAECAPVEPRLSQADAQNFETGSWLMHERLRCWEEQEFFFYWRSFT